MKNIILTILRTGYSKTKKYKAKDLCKKLFFLEHLIKDTEYGIFCKHNNFWEFDNRDNRRELINEIYKIRNFNVKDTHYFHIINEIVNGERFGIDIYTKEEV